MAASSYIKNLEAKINDTFTAECTSKGNVLSVNVENDFYLPMAKFLNEHSFNRLLTVSVVDWIKENEFEIYFLVHNFEENVYVKVSTRIKRDNPRIVSLSSIWGNSALHEREGWELFGVIFEGNSMLKPLFLEDWNGPPPFLKDFNWREYVKAELKEMMENVKDH